MSFDVGDFRDLLHFLEAHPEWQRELRRVLLNEDLLALPELVARTEVRLQELAEAQARTEARLQELAEAQARTEARLQELAEAQRRTEARLDALAEAQTRTEARLQELAEALERTEARLQELAEAHARLEARVARLEAQTGDLRGQFLEVRFPRLAPAYLGTRGYRRVRCLSPEDWADQLDEFLDAGKIGEKERLELLQIDAVARARDTEGEVWIAAEVSTTVDRSDVERARRRAQWLEALYGRSQAVVVGYRLDPRASLELEGTPRVEWIPVAERA